MKFFTLNSILVKLKNFVASLMWLPVKTLGACWLRDVERVELQPSFLTRPASLPCQIEWVLYFCCDPCVLELINIWQRTIFVRGFFFDCQNYFSFISASDVLSECVDVLRNEWSDFFELSNALLNVVIRAASTAKTKCHTYFGTWHFLC